MRKKKVNMISRDHMQKFRYLIIMMMDWIICRAVGLYTLLVLLTYLLTYYLYLAILSLYLYIIVV